MAQQLCAQPFFAHISVNLFTVDESRWHILDKLVLEGDVKSLRRLVEDYMSRNNPHGTDLEKLHGGMSFCTYYPIISE